MGATQFITHAYGKTIEEAFNTAYEDALWEHGHGGYTGTIAEKPGFVLVDVPPGVTFTEFVHALEDSWDKKPDWAPSNWDRLTAIYNDKWGDCLAVADTRHLDNNWIFFGWASC